MDVVVARVLAAPGAQKKRQRPHGRKLRRGPADVEQPVVEARLGRDAEVAAVGGPHLHGYQVGIVPFRMRGASRLRSQDIHLEGKHLQVVEQLVDGAFQIEHGAGAAGLLAAIHGVERDGGVQTEGERLGEVAAVDAPHVGPHRLKAQNFGDRRGDGVGHAQRLGVIVAGAHGDDGQDRAILGGAGHKAVHHLVHQAVAAERDDAAHVGAQLAGQRLPVAGPGRGEHLEALLAHALAQKPRRLGGRHRPSPALRHGVRDKDDLPLFYGRNHNLPPNRATGPAPTCDFPHSSTEYRVPHLPSRAVRNSFSKRRGRPFATRGRRRCRRRGRSCASRSCTP